MFHCSVIKDRFCIAVCLKQLRYYIMLLPACQEVFQLFLKLFLTFRLISVNFDILSQLTLYCQELFSRNFSVFTERRRRDLNPRAATNDLLPFQGSPFSHLGTSPNAWSEDQFCIAVCLKQLCYYIMSFPACQELFSTFLKLFLFLSCSNFDILSHPTGCCQELFSFLFDSFVISARSLRCNSDRIPPLPGFVNNFFNFSYNLFIHVFCYISDTWSTHQYIVS